MGLPINIDELVHGNTVEWERLEFKQGWNPEDVIHSMCAFANDINNWGGGYIIIGIAENNGQPILPPIGLEQNQLDSIQGEIINLAHQVQPNYFPITQPYIIDGKHILVLWCPVGDNRPYTAPSTLGCGAQRHSYIRMTSRSIIARDGNLRRLQDLAARIPFDDRINNRATIEDFDLGIIQAYLYEIKSDLYKSSIEMSFEDVCRTMLIAKGPDEGIRPVNVGLMFFSKSPELFFSRAQIELVWHQDNSGRKFKEFYFKGPLHIQLRDTLSFFTNNILGEQVVKLSGQAEADRFFNFPYDAIEEVLSNAVYHKSYEIGSPIEVQVWPDKIEVLSFPGPVPPVNAKILSTQKRIVSREYRNRRIGDFLKELKLTEGRGTGFPTIYNAMANNGSPAPVFETDEHSTHVLVTLPAHPLALDNHEENNKVNVNVFNSIEDIVSFCNEVGNGVSNGVSNGVGDKIRDILNENIHNRVDEVLGVLNKMTKRSELFKKMGLSNQSKNREKYLDPLIELDWIRKEFPHTTTSPKQRYITTESGVKLLQLLSK